MAKFKAALDSKTFAAAVDADLKLGGEVGVGGTPSMFINGKSVENPGDLEGLSKQIDALLAAP
jgi:protein-disulfide isomerase